MELRPYQRDAVDAVYRYLREHDDNPVVVIPTAGGKAVIAATICKDAVTRWNGRVLILAHVKELLEQAAAKLTAACPEVRIGVFSAGLGRKETRGDVIIAGIQSVHRRAEELGSFDIAIIDECHLLTTEGEGMFRRLLADLKEINPRLRIVGLTATPFRMDSGAICSPENLLNAICYEIGIKELIRDGFLSPLVSKAGIVKADTSTLHLRGGEFVADEAEMLMDQEYLVQAACREIVDKNRDRHACLIFAAGVRHATHIVKTFRAQHGIECGLVTGNTPGQERAELLARFRGDATFGLLPCEPLKYLCNVNVLTTGTDIPRIDCVVLLRPTNSPGLMYQSIGRGFRLCPGKRDALVLDFGGNIERHGPVDQLRVVQRSGAKGEPCAKECPECHSVLATGFAVCPDCGYEFPCKVRAVHAPAASAAGVLSGQVTVTKYDVQDTIYFVHAKYGAGEGSPRSMRVEYKVAWREFKSEWVCVEHEGYARRKAEAWWRRRSLDPVPRTAEHAVAIAEAGGLAITKSITVRSVAGEQFERITDCELGPVPEGMGELIGGEEVPF